MPWFEDLLGSRSKCRQTDLDDLFVFFEAQASDGKELGLVWAGTQNILGTVIDTEVTRLFVGRFHAGSHAVMRQLLEGVTLPNGVRIRASICGPDNAYPPPEIVTELNSVLGRAMESDAQDRARQVISILKAAPTEDRPVGFESLFAGGFISGVHAMLEMLFVGVKHDATQVTMKLVRA